MADYIKAKSCYAGNALDVGDATSLRAQFSLCY